MIDIHGIEVDVVSGVILASIIGIITFLTSVWRNNKNHKKQQKNLDNRFKEALITLAESFDNETERLHPDKNIPLLKPRIERLVSNGNKEF